MNDSDDRLRAWKKEGANRVFNAVFIGSAPLALSAGFFAAEASAESMLILCTTYYCTLAFYAAATA